MSDKKFSLKQGDIIYHLGGGMGSWACSREGRIPTGTVRVIGGVLMAAFSVYPCGFSNEVNWIPVDEKFNTPENLRSWIRQ
jgi:hypothetical protein